MWLVGIRVFKSNMGVKVMALSWSDRKPRMLVSGKVKENKSHFPKWDWNSLRDDFDHEELNPVV